MAHFTVRAHANAPIETTWSLLHDQRGMTTWLPVTVALESEGDPPPDGVGGVRVLTRGPLRLREQITEVRGHRPRRQGTALHWAQSRTARRLARPRRPLLRAAALQRSGQGIASRSPLDQCHSRDSSVENVSIEDDDGNKAFKVNGKAVRMRDTFILDGCSNWSVTLPVATSNQNKVVVPLRL
jgi:hypothetical protein